jgi:hypothetical protein
MDSQETQSQALTNKFDGIADALDIETSIVPEESTESNVEILPTTTKEQLKKDYEYTRANLYSLIEKGQEAVDGILELAQESDQPRAYEVAGQLIKHVGDVADKLVDLQKRSMRSRIPKRRSKLQPQTTLCSLVVQQNSLSF